MQNNNFAAIDIGSNGARLLIKNVKEDTMGNVEFTKVLFLRIPCDWARMCLPSAKSARTENG